MNCSVLALLYNANSDKAKKTAKKPHDLRFGKALLKAPLGKNAVVNERAEERPRRKIKC